MSLALTKIGVLEDVADALVNGGFVRPEESEAAARIVLKAVIEHLDYEVDITLLQDAVDHSTAQAGGS